MYCGRRPAASARGGCSTGSRGTATGASPGPRARAWQFVPVLAPSPAVRTSALDFARRNDIEVRSYFSVPLHRMPAFTSVPNVDGLPCTDELAERALSLPMANDLSIGDMDAIVASLVAATSG
jgi:dTDP-4-amino-4,6-dideoxygalactose transaminase